MTTDEERVPTQQEMLRLHQDAFVKLCNSEGVSGGMAHLATTFQLLQVQLATLCGLSEPKNDHLFGYPPAEVVNMQEAMTEALDQARLRLAEVGGWLDAAASQRRSLVSAVSRKAPGQ